MPEDQRFDGGYNTSKVDEAELLEKWEAFPKVRCDPTRYFSKYYVGHEIIKFATPLVEELSKEATNVSYMLNALLGDFKEMLSLYGSGSDIKHVEGYDSSEMNHSDKV